MNPESDRNGPIVSSLAGDPDLQQLLDDFVRNLPQKASALMTVLAEGDLATLQRLAHQLKGSAGGYGFPIITDAARCLELTARTTQDLEALSEQVRELAELCRRATSNAPKG